MEAGRELDVAVAEKVMGITCRLSEKNGAPYTVAENGWPVVCPHYSTDIAAAWAVLDKLRENVQLLCWYSPGDEMHNEPARVKLLRSGVEESGNSMPHAICLAALKAVGG